MFTLLVNSCKTENISPIGIYKGGKLHEQPALTTFPNDTNYSFSKLTDTALTTKLNEKINQIIVSQNIIGLSVTALIPDKGMWQLDTGYISKNNSILVDSNSVFYWASVGKLITSITIHLLIADGKIALTDKLKKWYPQFEYSDKITIEHLLTHTSGIYSFNSDSSFHYSNVYQTPTELLDIALSQNNLFQPGEYWSYSNTGYLLLALIAEKIEAKSFSEIVSDRISGPLNLKSLRALQPQELPSNLALSHKGGKVNETQFSVPLGAGNIVSDSKDMATFLMKLLTGQILPFSTVHAMFTKLYPMFVNTGQYYGLGIMLYDFNEINGTQNQWMGHSGGTENYKAVIVFDIKTQVIITVSVNQNTPAEAIAYSLLGLITE
ncbi:MAG: beta-lactamase family protein [Cytophagaceae bacterium]|jgi:D-alanyl-D-alanine carboxypeptidase|nr:beta-lactamase family protein [Cytophagaceae bacterium]